MTDASIGILVVAAASIALLHTLIGVDHYLPFVVIGRAKKWSLRRIAGITALCGMGHVAISILLGFVGISIGVAVDRLEWVEAIRGSLAAWALIAFGLTYATWSFVRARRKHRHDHVHSHSDGTIHAHKHVHTGEHLHVHEAKERSTVSVWSLFIIFALGPCEPLIPLLMAPAWEHQWWVVGLVALVFSCVTIGAMVILALVGSVGLRLIAAPNLEKHAGLLAGLAIASSGLMIQLLGI